jgi:hypothetical protein
MVICWVRRCWSSMFPISCRSWQTSPGIVIGIDPVTRASDNIASKLMVEHGEKAGFAVPGSLSLRNHYIKTLGIWASRLEQHKEKKR